MTWHTTKELYALFLASDWWIRLSRLKRNSVKHCERCPQKFGLQSHHKIYRENWFDTRLDDLEAICRSCHEKEHGIVREPKSVMAQQLPAIIPIQIDHVTRNRKKQKAAIRHRKKLRSRGGNKKLWKKRRKASRRYGLDYQSRWSRNVGTGKWSC